MEERLRLRPTSEQYREFGDYLCEAHSWYKHLPLLEGRRFVVFVAPDAGIGRLVARLNHDKHGNATDFALVTPSEGSEFTEEHPRLRYGWKTTKEYRGRFGYLDYMSRHSPNEPGARDAGAPVELPDEVEKRCGFVLFPYVSYQFAESLLWGIHDEALSQLGAGANHPARVDVLELHQLAQAREDACSALNESETSWAFSHRWEQAPPPDNPSAELRRYIELDDRVIAISTKLHNQEAEKIRRALAELDNWLLRGGES